MAQAQESDFFFVIGVEQMTGSRRVARAKRAVFQFKRLSSPEKHAEVVANMAGVFNAAVDAFDPVPADTRSYGEAKIREAMPADLADELIAWLDSGDDTEEQTSAMQKRIYVWIEASEIIRRIWAERDAIAGHAYVTMPLRPRKS